MYVTYPARDKVRRISLDVLLARARAGGEEVVNQHQSGCGGDETVGYIIKLCGGLASCRDSDLTLSILSRDFIDFQAATGRNRLRADA